MSRLYYIKSHLHLTPKYDQSLIIRDIAYFDGSDAHVNNKLDIFLPFPKTNPATGKIEEQETSRSSTPVIVHIHGGGWVRGGRTDEQRGGPIAGRTCAREGFVGVVVSYRLARISLVSFIAWALIFGLAIIIVGIALLSWQLIAGYAIFMIAAYAYNALYRVRKPVNLDHMMDDLCRALVYVRDHITEHYPNADPDQIYLSGHSAGSHLISLLVLDKSHLLRHGLSLTSIRGVIAVSGIYSLTNPTHDSKNNIRTWVFRVLYSSNLTLPKDKKMIEYSPIEYIKEDEQLPPFLVMSARYDMGLEVDAKRFVDKLKQSHYHVEYFVVNGSHATIANKFGTNDAQKHFFKFVRQHMKY